MQLSFSELDPQSRVWIFGSSEELDESRRNVIRETLKHFLATWAAHGTDLPSAVEIVDDRFVLVAADTSASPSGCSIDKLFHALQKLEGELELELIDSSRIFYRDGDGKALSVARPEFKRLVASGAVTPATVVFDTNVESIADVTSGVWQKPFAESWHASAFKS